MRHKGYSLSKHSTKRSAYTPRRRNEINAMNHTKQNILPAPSPPPSALPPTSGALQKVKMFTYHETIHQVLLLSCLGTFAYSIENGPLLFCTQANGDTFRHKSRAP